MKSSVQYSMVLVLGIMFVVCSIHAKAQQPPPFNEDIQAFRQQDKDSFPQPGAILFVGSSSFTMWKDVQAYFPRHRILNRGFGGSTLQDVIRYADEVITPYRPKQIVIYCGENDLASSDDVTAEMVLERFIALFNRIRKNDAAVPVAFVSLKPSPSRRHLWPKMVAANQLIKNFLRTKKKTTFIDVYHKMFNRDGTVIQDIFLEDDLHMNAKGYQIWKKAIEPYLIK